MSQIIIYPEKFRLILEDGQVTETGTEYTTTPTSDPHAHLIDARTTKVYQPVDRHAARAISIPSGTTISTGVGGTIYNLPQSVGGGAVTIAQLYERAVPCMD